MRALAVALISVLMIAAAEPELLVVRDQAAVTGCQALGEVRSSSLLGGLAANLAYGRTLDALKKKAKAKGATHLVLLDVSSGMTGSNMLGEAYRCALKAEPTAAQ